MISFSDEQIEKVALEKTKRLAKRLENEPETKTFITIDDDVKEDEKWDCETILTTYSNIYNHPKLITQLPKTQIRLSNKTGLPLEDQQTKHLKNKSVNLPTKVEESDNDDDDDEDEEEEEDGDVRPTISLERKKGETSEERRARKHAVKEMRRVRHFVLLQFCFDLKKKFILGSTNH